MPRTPLLKLLAVLSVLLVLVPVRPAAAGPRAPWPAAAAPRPVWHVVQPGDTMAGIARKFGLRTTQLAAWNYVPPPYRVYVDGTLRLNPPPPAGRLPVWRSRIEPVTAASVNWNPVKKCPVAPAALRRVWVTYIDFTGAHREGSIVVRHDIATRVQRAFQTLYRQRFRIMAMSPMSVNMPRQRDMSIVTAGFSCRAVAGTKTWSQHAYGLAVDLNPLQNPMLRGSYVEPRAGSYYVNRRRYLIGMVHGEGAARAFSANGLHWGGSWRSLRDWMHFSPTNR